MPVKLKQRQFYCVSCRARRMVPADDICVAVLKNKKVKGGVPALVGKCNKCDQSKMYKFIKRDDKDKMIEKYGKCRK